MPKRAAFLVASLAWHCAVQAQGLGDTPVGTRVRGAIEDRAPVGTRYLPVPPGEWEVASVARNELKLKSGRVLPSLLVVLKPVGEAGPFRVATVEATAYASAANVTWTRDACDAVDRSGRVLFADRYGTEAGSAMARCGQASALARLRELVGSSASSESRSVRETYSAFASQAASFPHTGLRIVASVAPHRADRAVVTILVDPAHWGLDSSPAALRNPFSAAALPDDPQRSALVAGLRRWTESFNQALYKGFIERERPSEAELALPAIPVRPATASSAPAGAAGKPEPGPGSVQHGPATPEAPLPAAATPGEGRRAAGVATPLHASGQLRLGSDRPVDFDLSRTDRWTVVESRRSGTRSFYYLGIPCSRGQEHCDFLRRQIDRIHPYALGKSTSARYTRRDGRAWDETLRVAGEAQIDTPLGRRAAWLVERAQQSPDGRFSGQWQYSVDKELEIPWSLSYRHLAGAPPYPLPDFVTTRFEGTPAPAAPSPAQVAQLDINVKALQQRLQMLEAQRRKDDALQQMLREQLARVGAGSERGEQSTLERQIRQLGDMRRRDEAKIAELQQRLEESASSPGAARLDPRPALAPLRVVALVIGNSRYKTDPLPNPRNDADAVAKLLRSFGHTVTVVLDGDRRRMIEALRKFGAAAQQADVGVLYYAGHGVQFNGVNYMIPIDVPMTGAEAIEFDAIPVDHAVDRYIGSKAKVVFLDACRDNPLTRSLSRTRSMAPQGLAPINASTGTLISFATKDGSVALDGEGRNSPYTAALLKHLPEKVDISLVLRRVRQTVIEATKGRQVPWDYGSLVGEELVLAR